MQYCTLRRGGGDVGCPVRCEGGGETETRETWHGCAVRGCAVCFVSECIVHEDVRCAVCRVSVSRRVSACGWTRPPKYVTYMGIIFILYQKPIWIWRPPLPLQLKLLNYS